MWKSRKDEPKPYTPPTQPPATPAPAVTPTAIPARQVRPVETAKMENYRSDVAHIGKSVVVKGELSGSEDLYLDGVVEGTIELNEHSLIVGPNGRVKATVRARDVIIHGKVDGNLQAAERVELKRTAILAGDIVTQRIVIEDGAMFKGGIDIQRPAARPEAKRETAAAAATGASAGAPVQ